MLNLTSDVECVFVQDAFLTFNNRMVLSLPSQEKVLDFQRNHRMV